MSEIIRIVNLPHASKSNKLSTVLKFKNNLDEMNINKAHEIQID
jgi:hypothetical protein